MEQLAIKGHETRGKEVIEILEMLGGKISPECGYEDGFDSHYVYFIDTNENYYIDGLLLIGDKNPTKLSIFTLEEFLEKYPYKVGDKVIDIKTDRIAEIYKAHWSESRNCTYYDLKLSNNTGFVRSYKFLKPYKEETMESKPNLFQQLKEYFDNTPREVLEKEWNELSYLNEIGPTVEEYLECVKKYRQLNQYPKTYEECCKILGIGSYFEPEIRNATAEECQKFTKLIRLKRCRNAYWKLAGEQMGLGKPWELDWKESDNGYVYCIVNKCNNIGVTCEWLRENHILSFPTKEMRDAFFENFEDLIEECKELL